MKVLVCDLMGSAVVLSIVPMSITHLSSWGRTSLLHPIPLGEWRQMLCLWQPHTCFEQYSSSCKWHSTKWMKYEYSCLLSIVASVKVHLRVSKAILPRRIICQRSLVAPELQETITLFFSSICYSNKRTKITANVWRQFLEMSMSATIWGNVAE